MQKDIEDFETRILNLLLRGDVPGMVEMFHLPVAIYLPDGVKVDVTSEQLTAGISDMLERMRNSGVVAADKVITHPPGQGDEGLKPYIVEIQFFNAKGREVRHTKIRRFLENRHGRLKVSMVEVIIPAFVDQERAPVQLRPN